MARGVSGRRITSGLALSSPPLTCAGSQIATNPDDGGGAAQRSQGEVRPDIEGHGAPPRRHWAPQPKRAPYSVLAQAAVAGSTQRLTRDLLNGGRAASVFEDEALTAGGHRLAADGRAFTGANDMTCRNWTSSESGAGMVGHHDRMGLRDDEPSKNTSHPSRGRTAAAARRLCARRTAIAMFHLVTTLNAFERAP